MTRNGMRISWGVRVMDRGGAVVSERKGSNSILKNFCYCMVALFTHEAQTVTDTGGTSRSSVGVRNYKPGIKMNASANDDTLGIVVGTGTVAPVSTDYALGARIAHGTGTGQLSHGVVSVDTSEHTATTSSLSLHRTFTNSSSGEITAKEIGMITNLYTSGGTAYDFLVFRDLIDDTTVPIGGTMLVTYTISVEAPLLKNFILMLTGLLIEGFCEDIVERGGETKSLKLPYASNWNLTGLTVKLATGDTNTGLAVGTGSTAVTMDDYDLETPGATMSVDVCNVSGPHTGGSSESYLLVTRNFINPTEDPITLREVGLAVKLTTGSTNYYVLIMREIINRAVGADETLPIEFKLRMFA